MVLFQIKVLLALWDWFGILFFLILDLEMVFSLFFKTRTDLTSIHETIKHECNTLWPCIHETFECCLSRMGASVGSFESYFLVMVCKVESELDIGCSIEIDALNQGLRSPLVNKFYD